MHPALNRSHSARLEPIPKRSSGLQGLPVSQPCPSSSPRQDRKGEAGFSQEFAVKIVCTQTLLQGKKQRSAFNVLLSCSQSLRQGLTNPELTNPAGLAGQARLGDPLSPPSQCWDYKQARMPGLSQRCWEWNSGLQASLAGMLLTEPSP